MKLVSPSAGACDQAVATSSELLDLANVVCHEMAAVTSSTMAHMALVMPESQRDFWTSTPTVMAESSMAAKGSWSQIFWSVSV